MKSFIRCARSLLAAAPSPPLAAPAQNIATVNGKPVPKARVDTLVQQVQAGARRPAAAARAREARRATRSCCARSSRRRPRSAASPASADYKAQMELARQTILIRELFEDFKKKNPVTDAEPRPSTTSSRPSPPAPNTARATSWWRRKTKPRS